MFSFITAYADKAAGAAGAATTAAGAAQQAGPVSMMSPLIMLVAMFAISYQTAEEEGKGTQKYACGA